MTIRTFVIFKMIGECAMNSDPVVCYVHGTNADAQKVCTDHNSKSNTYYYYMSLDNLKAHGFEV